MRSSFATALVALSTAVSALPTAAPAKFALQITAQMKGSDGKPAPVSLFLGKGGNGNGVADQKDAESCSIDEKTQLVCGGKAMGVSTSRSSTDMAAIAPVSGAGTVTTGFSVDANNVLHWKNDELAQKLPAFKAVVDGPDSEVKKHYNGEAQFGLFKSGMLTGGKTLLYFQLGCPGSTVEGGSMKMGEGTHNGMHDPVVEGVSKVIPL